jgi:tetratricopeptide (TPR) repeat protein
MMNSESTLRDALSEVNTALAASDNERAAGLASELLLAYPNAVSVLRQRARALAAANRSLQSAEVHRRVLEILPADGEAMAGLARTLHAAGQTDEAREAARQALDYLTTDEALMRIAVGDGQPFQPDEASMLLRKSLAQTQVGMMSQGIAGLRTVVARWPDRVDARVALMQALWRDGERISAAEQAQSVLDDYPNCMNAHMLLLEVWRAAGASSMERAHQQALEQVDPDHRVMHAMLGTKSPLPVIDVPARPVTAGEPAITDEDPLAREDWVDNLVAAASASPKPLEQLRPEVATSSALDAEDLLEEDSEFVAPLIPLEWSVASDLSEESAPDDFSVSWIEGDVKNAFTPSRPPAAIPDPRDGVPEAIEPLEWETGGDETSSPPVRTDFTTAVDGGAAQHEPAKPAEDSSLGAFAAALALATAKHAAKPPAEDKAASAVSAEPSPALPALAAHPESVPEPTRAETKTAQAMKAEVESAAVKPMPIDAVEFVDEAADDWDETDSLKIETPPASKDDKPQPPRPIAADNSASPQAEAPAQAPVTTHTAPAEDTQQGSMLKAVASAAILGAAARKHKKRSGDEAQPAEARLTEATPPTQAEAAPPAAEEAEEKQAEAVAPPQPAKAPEKAPAKTKRAKKPAPKPTSREVQTEKIRKTYERAIATAKRDDMPKLITELSQAAEVDPDNKIIFELLGQAYNRQGDIPAAINAYRKALSLAEHA